MLHPSQPAPQLDFETVAHGRYDLFEGAPPEGTFVSIHRGSLCKFSRSHVKELDDRIGDFAIRGLRVVALSAESAEATAQLAQEMQIIRLPLGYGADVAMLQSDWGVYATRNNDGALMAEPAMFWLRQDRRLGLCLTSSAPQLRPDVTTVLRAIDAVAKAPDTGAA